MSQYSCPICGSAELKVRRSTSHAETRCIFSFEPCVEGPHTHWRCRRCGWKTVTS